MRTNPWIVTAMVFAVAAACARGQHTTGVYVPGSVDLQSGAPLQRLPKNKGAEVAVPAFEPVQEDVTKQPENKTGEQPQSPIVYDLDPAGGVCKGCGHSHRFRIFLPWSCKDLQPTPVDRAPRCGCRHGWLWCPQEPQSGEDNGEKKDDDENGDDDSASTTPLMAWINGIHGGEHCCKRESKIQIYGWLQQGFTGNFDSPNNRLNFGVNYNNRSNDILFNQQYIVIEKAIEQNDSINFGFRLDFYGGQDAPDNTAIQFGWFERVNTRTPTTNSWGIDVPQIYGQMHLPILTKRGVDIRAGWFYTNMGYEVIPAKDTDFYSHAYELFYGVPFYHSGVELVVHLGDTVDFMHMITRGWDAFTDDINDTWSYHGYLSWTSCDQRRRFIVAWITGDELANNRDNRTLITAYYTHKFGCYDQWRFVTGGSMGWQNNGGPNGQDAEWYGYTAYLFYTIDPRVTLGCRGEWFHDDDGFRTGFATSFWEVTFGVTWRPYQNLRIRPEIRFDWADRGLPYDDNTDNSQATAAIDVIWEF